MTRTRPPSATDSTIWRHRAAWRAAQAAVAPPCRTTRANAAHPRRQSISWSTPTPIVLSAANCSSTAKPIAIAVSKALGTVLVTTRSKAPRLLPMRRARSTPACERCRPGFVRMVCRRTSNVRTICLPTPQVGASTDPLRTVLRQHLAQPAGDLLGCARLQRHRVDEHAALPAADVDAGIAVAERCAVRIRRAFACKLDPHAWHAGREEQRGAVIDRDVAVVDTGQRLCPQSSTRPWGVGGGRRQESVAPNQRRRRRATDR